MTFKRFLRPHLSGFKWFRRWYGGRWGYWQTSLPMVPVWLDQWDRPGCGEYMIKREYYGPPEKTEFVQCQFRRIYDDRQCCELRYHVGRHQYEHG